MDRDKKKLFFVLSKIFIVFIFIITVTTSFVASIDPDAALISTSVPFCRYASSEVFSGSDLVEPCSVGFKATEEERDEYNKKLARFNEQNKRVELLRGHFKRKTLIRSFDIENLIDFLKDEKNEKIALVWFEKKSRYFNPFNDFMMFLQHKHEWCSKGPKEYVWWFSDLDVAVDDKYPEDSVEFKLARIQECGFDVTKFRVIRNAYESDRAVFALLFTEEQFEAISEYFDSDEDASSKSFFINLSSGQIEDDCLPDALEEE